MNSNTSAWRYAGSTGMADTTQALGGTSRTAINNDTLSQEDTISDPVTIARLLIQVSSFLEAEYVNDAFLKFDKTIYAVMRDTSKRLIYHHWVIVDKNNSRKAAHPWRRPDLRPEQAIDGMEKLCRFFERRDKSVREQQGPDDMETGLSKYLFFAANYTRRLQKAISGQDKSRHGNNTMKCPTPVVSQSINLPNFEHLDLSPFFIEAASSMFFNAIPNKRLEVEASKSPPLEQSDHANNGNDSETYYRLSGMTTPHELRPTLHAQDHAPHVFQGSRHHSQYTAPEWATFAEHPQRLGKWVDDTDEHNTVQIGHAPGVCSHACEADFLGICGVRYIKLVHPLCAVETKLLDLDILRFIQLVLEHRILNHDSSENAIPAQAEWRSLEILKRELAIRQWESNRLTLEDSEFPDSPTTEASWSIGTRTLTPHDLGPLPHDPKSHPHPLQGRRLDSRTWFENDLTFVSLIGKPKQWTHPMPETYTPIHGRYESITKYHFVDASVLGIPVVNIIQLQHPLDARDVRKIDIDILKFVRLALWDWTNGIVGREVERVSLEIVRRELEERRGERKSAAEEAAKATAVDSESGSVGGDLKSTLSGPPSYLDPYDNGHIDPITESFRGALANTGPEDFRSAGDVAVSQAPVQSPLTTNIVNTDAAAASESGRTLSESTEDYAPHLLTYDERLSSLETELQSLKAILLGRDTRERVINSCSDVEQTARSTPDHIPFPSSMKTLSDLERMNPQPELFKPTLKSSKGRPRLETSPQVSGFDPAPENAVQYLHGDFDEVIAEQVAPALRVKTACGQRDCSYCLSQLIKSSGDLDLDNLSSTPSGRITVREV